MKTEEGPIKGIEPVDFVNNPKTDHLFKLRKRILSVTFLLGFLILFSSKISPYYGLLNSWVYKVSFVLSILLGIFYLILDRKLKTSQVKTEHFKSMLETKEDFYRIFREVLTVRLGFDFIKQAPGFLYDELPKRFDLDGIQEYIINWSRPNSIFSKHIKSEITYPTIALLIFPINSLQSIAMLLGSTQFSRLFINAALKHKFISVKEENITDEGLYILYRVDLKVTITPEEKIRRNEFERRSGKSLKSDAETDRSI